MLINLRIEHGIISFARYYTNPQLAVSERAFCWVV